MIKIDLKINNDEWKRFLSEHKNANPFQSPEMLKVLKECKLYDFILVGARNENNDLVGVLLSQVQKDYKSVLGNFTARSIIWGGPVVKDNRSEIVFEILKEYDKIASKKAIYTQFRNLWDIHYGDGFEKSGFYFDDHLNILIDLSVGEEELWKNIKKSRKEGIRKAKRNDLVFEVNNCSGRIGTFYKLLKNTFDNVKKPFPKIDFFEAIAKNFDESEVKLFELKKDNEVIVSLLAFTCNKCIYAYYIGTNREHKYFLMRPIDLLYWETIRWGALNGMELFDWMGAGKPDIEYGVRKFKLQYGGEMSNLGRFEKTHKPNLMKLGKLGLKLYQKIK
ncbi:MAG: hypothetical protein CSB55_08660 [Candidatus Cloacimonadota bacterium]|nr:MAG: hypothetical protein CSB55_08660 [Candidatus Cloacimonadota bacterium]